MLESITTIWWNCYNSMGKTKCSINWDWSATSCSNKLTNQPWRIMAEWQGNLHFITNSNMCYKRHLHAYAHTQLLNSYILLLALDQRAKTVFYFSYVYMSTVHSLQWFPINLRKLKYCPDSEAINEVIKHLKAAIRIPKALSENPITQHLLKVKSICPNANSEKQVFKPMKRKRSSQSQSIKKPGQVNILNARQLLKSSTVIVCGICFQEDDNPQDLGQTTNTVEWIECNKCGVWVHESCSKVKTNDYRCSNCTTTNNEWP